MDEGKKIKSIIGRCIERGPRKIYFGHKSQATADLFVAIGRGYLLVNLIP